MLRLGRVLTLAFLLAVLAHPCLATVWSRPQGPFTPEAVLATEVVWGASSIAVGFMNVAGSPGAGHPYIMSLVGLGLAAGSFALASYEFNEAPELDGAAGIIGVIGSLIRIARVREAELEPEPTAENQEGAGRVNIRLSASPRFIEWRLSF